MNLFPDEVYQEPVNITKFCFGIEMDKYKFDPPCGEGKKGILLVLPPIIEGGSATMLTYVKTLLQGRIEDVLHDCYVYFSLICPHDKLKLETKHINCCRKQMQKQLQDVKYSDLYIVGEFAFNLFYPSFSGRMKNKGYEEFIFDTFYDRKLQHTVAVFPDNEYLKKYRRVFKGRKYVKKEALTVRDNRIKGMSIKAEQVKQVITECDQWPIKPKDHLEASEIIASLNKILKSACPIAIDYETNQLKSNDNNALIHCVGIYSEETGGFAFSFRSSDFTETETTIVNLFKAILKDELILKIAHNIYFEQSWSLNYFDQDIVNGYCTQIAEFVIDNTKSVGLKNLVFRYFGDYGYDDYIDHYLRPDGVKWGYDGNLLHLADPKRVRYYCTLDCIYTYYLWKIQQRYFETDKSTQNELKGAYLLIEGSMELGWMTSRNGGIRIDTKVLNQVENQLVDKLKSLNQKIKATAKDLLNGKICLFNPTGKTCLFDHNREDHMYYLIFDFLGYKKEDWPQTPGGKPKMSKDVLVNYEKDHEILQLIITYRKYYKLYTTYLPGIQREVNLDGFITPLFSLAIAKTFRSASSLPNFQNFPKRDKEQMTLIRSLMFPKLGHKIVEFDYKAIEVGIAAHYYKDPVLMDYVADSSKDMHRDTALGLFVLTLEQYNKLPYNKALRFAAKNGYVFPAFYGSLGVNSAEGIWKLIPAEIMPHLETRGIGNLKSWIKHVEKYDDIFWGERFKIFSKNKEKLWTHYQKYGKVKLFTGMQAKRIMNRNECINIPIQGPAFHCLLRLLTQLNRWLRQNQYNSYIMGQIHDSIVLSVDPAEESVIDAKVHEIGEQQVKKELGIKVPLTLEKESAGVNESWACVH